VTLTFSFNNIATYDLAMMQKMKWSVCWNRVSEMFRPFHE
jgi:hypothetical protein